MPIARFVMWIMVGCVVIGVVAITGMNTLGKLQQGGSAIIYSVREGVSSTSIIVTAFNTFPGLPAFSQLLPTSLPYAENLVCSPNGDYIAFSSLNLYVIDIFGNNLERLTYEENVIDLPIEWLPNAHQIAFSRNEVGNIATTLYLWDRDTQSMTVVYPVNNLPISSDWSNDGQQIIYTLIEHEPFTAQIYVSDANGQNPTRLTTDDQTLYFGPRWSPDGSKILFFTAIKAPFEDYIFSQGIYIMNNDGSNIQQLTDLSAYDPIWSPDGRFIVFTVYDQHYDLFVMDINSRELTQITNNIYIEESVCWLP